MPEKPLKPCQYPGCGVLGCTHHGWSRLRGRPKASPSKRGYGRDWQALRRRKLQADYLCEFCLDRGKDVLAEVVDHIRPIAEAPKLRLVWSNLRSLCKVCHDKHTLSDKGGVQGGWAARPKGLKPSRVPLTIVCGPAGSGKSTYVDKHAGPNDLVLDLDSIKARIAGDAEHLGVGGDLLKAAMRSRNHSLRSLATERHYERAWFIVGAPKACDRQWWQDALKPERIVVLDVDPGECSRRIEAGRTGRHRVQTIKAAFEWWQQYVKRDGDVVVT